jgi:hypothetical protein
MHELDSPGIGTDHWQALVNTLISNGTSGSVENRELTDLLSDCYFLANGFAP